MKKTWLAGLLSVLIPGAGQIYATSIARGSFFFILNVVVYFIASQISLVGFVLLFVWIFTIIDAVSHAKKVNGNYEFSK